MSGSMRRVNAALERDGLLLETDARLPSVAGIVAAATGTGPVRGSWWGHPAGRAIFRCCERLVEQPDVVIAKLVSGKITYIHERLWPALISVARSREGWQTRGLPAAARDLLRIVETRGPIRADETGASGPVVTALERRLLVHSVSVHTETGAHARRLQTWERWARERRYRLPSMPVNEARRVFETIVSEMNARHKARGRLPWPTSPR